MTPQAIKSGQAKCAAKTAKGNCYLTLEEAEHEAVKMSLSRRIRVVAFRCKFGNHYHLGGHRYRRPCC